MPFKNKVKRKICRYYREGICSKGVRCPFPHPPLDKDGNVKICRFVSLPNGCTKKNCQYAHTYQHDDHEEKIKDHGEESTELSTKISRLTSDNDKYKQQVSDLQQSNLELESKLAQSNELIGKTKKNLEDMEEERDQLDEAYEELKLKTGKMFKSQDAEISDLKKQLELTDSQITLDRNRNTPGLHLNSDDLKDEHLKSELHNTKSQLEEEKTVTNKLRSDLEVATRKIESLKVKIKGLWEDFAFLKSELHKKDTIIMRQEQQILPYLPELMEMI